MLEDALHGVEREARKFVWLVEALRAIGNRALTDYSPFQLDDVRLC